MNIVKQCYFLDSILGSHFTDEVLKNSNLSLRDLRKHIIEADRKRVEEKSKDLLSLLYVLHVAEKNLWLKFWDVALEYGQDGSIISSMALLISYTYLWSQIPFHVHLTITTFWPSFHLVCHF